MRYSLRLSIAFLPVIASLPVLAQPAAPKAAFAIVEKKAGEVGFYTTEGKRLSGVKVGEHPHEIVTSPDRKTAYVSDNGILWMQYAGEGGNTISIVDLASRKKLGVIDLGRNRRPHGMAVDPATGRLLVTTENPDGLVLVDPKARQVAGRFDTGGKAPHMVTLGPGAVHAYASNTNTNTVGVIQLASGKLIKTIAVDGRPQGGVLSRDGKRIYLTCSDGNSIVVIDTAKHEVTGRVKSSGKGPGRVALTPDEKTLIYNLQPGNGIGFADTAALKEIAVVALPGAPLSMTLSRDGKTAYLGLQDSDKVAIVSVLDRKLIRVFDTPKDHGPDPVLPLD
jgi:YVTN family beta-propeller protein